MENTTQTPAKKKPRGGKKQGRNCEMFYVTQPADWIAAFKAEAVVRGMSMSEFIGESCKAQLAADVRESLSGRPTAGRPPKVVASAE